jgi:hypothetical protein
MASTSDIYGELLGGCPLRREDRIENAAEEAGRKAHFYYRKKYKGQMRQMNAILVSIESFYL